MSDFVPDPANYVMKGNPAKEGFPKTVTQHTDPADLVAVKDMTWRKLVATLDAMPPGAAVLPLAREIMDRIDGKPAQSINHDHRITQVNIRTLAYKKPITISGDGNALLSND